MTWQEADRAPLERADALLAAAEVAPRGELKRLGAWLDGPGADLRPALVARARARGVEVPDEAVAWPGKRLVRICRGHEEAARERRNPIRRDEAFDCAHCGAAVTPHGRTARDHCPLCLFSLHVDVVPGDRAADCGGLLEPVGLELANGQTIVSYRCQRCGARKRNRAVLDGDVPDSWQALAQLSARAR